jgi:hypothetical protein
LILDRDAFAATQSGTQQFAGVEVA